MTTIQKSSNALVLVKLTAIEDQSTRTWHDQFEFCDLFGRKQNISVPRDVAADSKKLLSRVERLIQRLGFL